MIKSLSRINDVIRVQGIPQLIRKAINYYFRSDYDFEIKNAIRRNSKEYEIFVDIGAGIGSVCIDVANLFSKCLCFEPSLENFNQLKKTVYLQGINNIEIFNLALGQKNETRKFYISKSNRFNSRFTSGIWESDEEFETSTSMVDTLTNIFASEKINDKCIIKIDVEGLELDVMKGAKNILKKDCIIISEFYPFLLSLNKTEPFEYVEFMNSFGYGFFDLNGKEISKKYLTRICSLGKTRKYIVDDFLIKKI